MGSRTIELAPDTKFIRRIQLEATAALGRELSATGEMVSHHGERGPGGAALFHWEWTGGCSGWGEDQTYAPPGWLKRSTPPWRVPTHSISIGRCAACGWSTARTTSWSSAAARRPRRRRRRREAGRLVGALYATPAQTSCPPCSRTTRSRALGTRRHLVRDRRRKSRRRGRSRVPGGSSWCRSPFGQTGPYHECEATRGRVRVERTTSHLPPPRPSAAAAARTARVRSRLREWPRTPRSWRCGTAATGRSDHLDLSIHEAMIQTIDTQVAKRASVVPRPRSP
jgi:hypothetical protein